MVSMIFHHRMTLKVSPSSAYLIVKHNFSHQTTLILSKYPSFPVVLNQ